MKGLLYIKTVIAINKKTNKISRGSEQIYKVTPNHWGMTLYNGEIVKTFKGQVAHDIVYDGKNTIVSFYTEHIANENSINEYKLISREEPRKRSCKVKRIKCE